MTTRKRDSSRTILNRIDELWAQLRSTMPREVDELQRLLRVQEGADIGLKRPLAGMSRQPSAAVMLLITEMDRPLSKADVFEGLVQRGYPCTSSAEKGLVNDAINRLVKNGELLSNGGERSAMVVRLPDAPSRKHSK